MIDLPKPELDSLPRVTERLAATAPEYDRTGEFPAAGIDIVHQAGLLTATVGSDYGAQEWGIAGQARTLAALGEGDPSVALIAAMTLFVHTRQAKSKHWPEALYATVLRESATRPTLLNAARVEPELGSGSRGGYPDTTARKTADGWAITGRKRFVTGAEGLAYFLVWATTDEPDPRVGTFVVPGVSPGIEIHRDWRQLGLRASGSHDVTFTDVEIPEEHVLDATVIGAGGGLDSAENAAINLALTALYLGVGRAAQRYFHRFAHERVPANLGRPVATTERFRLAAGEIETLLSGAEELLLGVAERIERDEPVSVSRAFGARVLATRHIQASVEIALRLLGNPGLSQDNPLERHFRDVQSASVHAPQEDVALLHIGQMVLGESATGSTQR
jgi:alkylation response protein AidB-like acyl-CoA dehydrogenase